MTTEAQVRQELGDAFQEAVTEHEDVMAECESSGCPLIWTSFIIPLIPQPLLAVRVLIHRSSGVSILRLYNLTPASLFYKYEAFLLSRPSGLRARLSVLTLETVRELKKEIQREQQAKAVAGVNGMSGSGEGAAKSGGMSVGVRKGKGNMADLGGLYVLLVPNVPLRPTDPPAWTASQPRFEHQSLASPTLPPASQTHPTTSSYPPPPDRLSRPHQTRTLRRRGQRQLLLLRAVTGLLPDWYRLLRGVTLRRPKARGRMGIRGLPALSAVPSLLRRESSYTCRNPRSNSSD
jgi:DNA polymerase alpha subunit B